MTDTPQLSETTTDQPDRPVYLWPAQLAFVECRKPYAAFVGGIGSGKSYVLCYDLIRRSQPRGLYMVCAPTYPMLRDSTMRTFFEVAERLGRTVEYHRAEDRVVMTTSGAEILFRSADNPDRLRGPNLSGVALDEASFTKEDVFRVLVGRLRQGGGQGWLRAVFTPQGIHHWTFKRFGTGEYPDTELVRARTRDNPFLDASFVETVSRQYDDLTAAQELDGEFVDVEGAEWPVAYFRDAWFDDWPGNPEVKVLALDPSRGRESKTGDYAAYVLALTHYDESRPREASRLVYADAVFLRRPLDQVISEGVRLAGEFRPHGLVVETNIGMELLAREFTTQLGAANILCPVVPVENTVPKPVRIRRLGGYLSHRLVRFRNTPGGRLLVAQLQQFPFGEHDDGPDALELAVRQLAACYPSGV